MRRTLEAIFRHQLQLAIMMIVPILIALAVVMLQPRAYEASTTLWALQRYSVIGATGPEADLTATPASTQATALQELLQTRSFSLSVANETQLASTYPASTRDNVNTLNDALFSEISKNVRVTPSGYNLYQVVYDNKNPQIAQQVIAAVVDRFGAEASQFSVVEAKQLLLTYAGQLNQAKTTSTNATEAASKYLATHPASTAQNDPVYSQLLIQAQADQANVLNLQATIAQINQQLATVGNGSGGLYSVIDAPAVGDKPVSRLKTLLLGGGIGLAVALLGCTIYLVMLLRQDHTAQASTDLRRVTTYPVLLEIPYLPATTMSLPAEASNGRRSKLKRGR